MIKLLCGGGLGDACLCFAQLSGKEAPFKYDKENLHITHQVLKDKDEKLKNEISWFYNRQGIKNEVVVIDSWDKTLNKKDFDFELGGGWNGKVDCNSWEINPFPIIKYEKIENIDTVLVISSGRDLNRRFEPNEVREFAEKYPCTMICGIDKKGEYENIGKNVVNKTSFDTFVDIICSCNTLIGHSGFCCYLAGMANKKVYCVSEGKATEINKHPNWNFVMISSLKEVVL
jgi:hypothetical protein